MCDHILDKKTGILTLKRLKLRCPPPNLTWGWKKLTKLSDLREHFGNKNFDEGSFYKGYKIYIRKALSDSLINERTYGTLIDVVVLGKNRHITIQCDDKPLVINKPCDENYEFMLVKKTRRRLLPIH